jgi:hypothetical protein
VTVEATSRIQILKTPLAIPGKCIVCGAVDSEQGRTYIDFGFSIKFYGAVYFCSFCFVEIAEALDFIKNTKFLQLLETNQELKVALSVKDKRIEALNGILRDSFDIDSPADTLRDVSDDTEISSDSEGTIPVPDEPTENNDESSIIEGHSGLRGTSESNATGRGSRGPRKSDHFEF